MTASDYDDDPFFSDSYLRYNDIHDYVWTEEEDVE